MRSDLLEDLPALEVQLLLRALIPGAFMRLVPSRRIPYYRLSLAGFTRSPPAAFRGEENTEYTKHGDVNTETARNPRSQ